MKGKNGRIYLNGNVSKYANISLARRVMMQKKKYMKPQKFFYETNTILQKNAKNYQKFAIAFCQPISNNREQSWKK